jgi:hypothetical protein
MREEQLHLLMYRHHTVLQFGRLEKINDGGLCAPFFSVGSQSLELRSGLVGFQGGEVLVLREAKVFSSDTAATVKIYLSRTSSNIMKMLESFFIWFTR